MVDTDFTLSEMLKYAPYILKINMDNVNIMRIEGEAEYRDEISYFFPDDEENDRLIREYFTPDISEVDVSEIKARDSAIGANSTEYEIDDVPQMHISESDITVYIMDYSVTRGEKLEEITQELKEAGYNVVGGIYSQTAYCEETYCISSEDSAYSPKVAETLGLDKYYLNPEHASEADVVVVIGKDI